MARFLIAQDVFADAPFAATQPDVRAGLALLQQWCAPHRGGLSQKEFDAVESDYTRLFRGSQTSSWHALGIRLCGRERLLFSRLVASRDWYARFGLESPALSEPEDHVGLEFAFLAHLAGLLLAGHLTQRKPGVSTNC